MPVSQILNNAGFPFQEVSSFSFHNTELLSEDLNVKYCHSVKGPRVKCPLATAPDSLAEALPANTANIRLPKNRKANHQQITEYRM